MFPTRWNDSASTQGASLGKAYVPHTLERLNPHLSLNYQTLLDLAEILALSEAERDELLTLAGFPFPSKNKPPTEEKPPLPEDETIDEATASPPTFPLKAHKRETIKPKCYMETTVYLDETGHLEGNTHLWTEKWFEGFTGGIFVMFRDKNNMGDRDAYCWG